MWKSNFTARLFPGFFASSSTPSTLRLLDGVAMPVPRAPDTLVDFHTERDHRVRPSVYASLSCRTCAPRCGRRRDPSLQSPAVPSCLTTNYGVTPAEGIYGPREPVSGGFLSLPLRGVSGGQDEQTPTRWVRPGSRRWQPFRDLQGRTVSAKASLWSASPQASAVHTDATDPRLW